MKFIFIILVGFTYVFSQNLAFPKIKPYESDTTKKQTIVQALTEKDLMELGKESPARFLQIDRYAEKYPTMNPYTGMANNPVFYTDPTGDTIRVHYFTQGQGMQSVYYNEGSFYNNDGSKYTGNNSFVSSVGSALASLNGSDVGKALVDYLTKNTRTVGIHLRPGRNEATADGNNVLFDPNKTTGGIDENKNVNTPSFVGLGHEFAHVQDHWEGTANTNTWLTVGNKNISQMEKYASHVENMIRSDLNMPLRTHYVNVLQQNGSYTGYEPSRILNSNRTSKFYTGVKYVNGRPVLVPFSY